MIKFREKKYIKTNETILYNQSVYRFYEVLKFAVCNHILIDSNRQIVGQRIDRQQ